MVRCFFDFGGVCIMNKLHCQRVSFARRSLSHSITGRRAFYIGQWVQGALRVKRELQLFVRSRKYVASGKNEATKGRRGKMKAEQDGKMYLFYHLCTFYTSVI